MRYSELNTYLLCPQKYHYVYVENKKEETTLDLEFGTSMHAALECAFEGLDAKEVFINEFRKWQDADLKRYAYSFDSLLTSGKLFIDNFCENYLHKFKTIAVEQQFTTKINGIEYSGTIDCVCEFNGTLSVVDFKTSDKPYQRSKIESNLQMYLYAHAAQEIFNMQIEQVVYMIFIKSEAPRILTQIKKIDRNILDKHLNNACEISKQALSGVRYKNFNSCQYCSFIKECWP